MWPSLEVVKDSLLACFNEFKFNPFYRPLISKVWLTKREQENDISKNFLEQRTFLTSHIDYNN